MRLNMHFGVLAPLILLIGFSNNKLAYAQQKIMPTGNSITVGVGSSGVGGYRDDLQTMLGNESVSFLFVGSQDDGSTTHQPNHEGHGGQETIFFDNNINTWLTTETPNFVILHIGTNDISGNIAPETARDNIDSILGKIRTFDPNIKIILCSIVPRTDAKDGNTDALNILIEALYFTKLAGGGNVFYAGVNETFKSNPSWAADYMSSSIHPNDTGYNIMAGVIFNAIMNCINGTDLTVLDNFNRSSLGVTWAADPEYAIVSNELSNTHSVVEWGFLAVYKAMKNPKSIAVRFGQNADAAGINQGAVAVMLDSASPDADGYMVWVQSDGKIQLWTIVNGAPGAAIDDQDGSLSPPQSGDELKVLISSDATSHHFDVFINGELHGRVSDSQKLQGNNPILYAGVKLKGGLNNDIDDFKLQKTNDVLPPGQITDLRVDSSDATSIALAWTATGDDGDEGQASAVDLRISTATITANNFENATKVLGVGTPNVAGTPETFTVSGLLPSMIYFFAIKAVDDAGLISQISNVAFGGTAIGLSAIDDFNRASLGGNWNVASSYSIVSNELSNTSGIDDWTGIAVYNAFTNPVTASLRYGVNVSANGIKVTVLVLMLNESNEATADGYMVWHTNGNIRLWEVQNGLPANELAFKTAVLSDPSAGDILSVNMSSDVDGHHFDVNINGAFDGQLTDPAKLQGNGTKLYAGVMLKGGQSNNIDDFSLTSPLGDPASITITGGQNQIGLVDQQLPEPLAVQVLDENNNPAVGTPVMFSVVSGGGLIQAIADPNRVVLEAESGNLISPMQSSSDGSASNGQFIYVPDGAGQNGLAIFNFEISVAGNYVIWGRGIAENDTDDSFFISIDDGVEQLWDMFQGVTAADWTWDQVSDRGSGSAASPETNPVEFNLSVGTHKLEVRQREDGAKLDEIIITRDLNFIPSGIVPANSAVVDENGDAMAIWTLGPTIGANSVQASVSGLLPVFFNATATPDTAQSITKDSGDNQTGTAGQPLSNPFGVLVVGKIGSPLAGVDVTFSVIEGDGNFGGLSQITVASDSQGIAGATLTLGSVTGATNRAEASVLISGNHIIGSPMTFTATSALPQKLEAVSQLTQSGTANSALADSIEVRVRDTLDNPLPGFPVELSVTLGGGRVNGSESPVTVLTNAAGVAKVQWRLGSTAGSNNNKIQASAKFLGNEIIGSPVEFTASAQAGSAANLAMVSGNDQTGLIQSDLAQPFVIKVTDGANNPIAGWPVKFKVLAGGGKFSGADSVEVITNSSGEASATLTFGSEAGTPQNPFNNIVETSAENNNQALSGSPLTFRASAVSTGATHFEEISGNDLTARAGEPLPQPVTVKVTDGPPASNPIAGHSVRFRITGGGGTINDLTTTDTTITTDANGFASVSWYMGGDLASNAQKLEVSATDGINNLTGSPMSFQATATAGAVDPDASFLTASPSTVLADGQSRTTLTVTLTDKFGNRIPGSPVTLNSTGSNNIFQQPQNPTDSNGQVTSTLASTSAEIKSVSARIIGGISLNSFTNVTFIPLAPEKVAISRGDSQSGNIGTALDQPMEVLVTDKNNNNVPGIDVTFQVAGGGGYLMDESSTSQGQSVTVQTDSLGKARAIWILGPNAGTNTAEAAVSFNGSELTGSPRNFNGTGVTASATTMAIFNGDNQQGGIAGITLPKPLQVKIMDAAGKPVFDVPVNFTIQLGGGTLANANPRTDYRGIAESLFALDPIVGTNIVNASSGNLAGSPTVFTFLSVVGTPAILTAKIGHGGSAVVNSLYPIAVEITDINGNPIEGTRTNFAVVEGSGSIEGPQNPLTDAAGLAQTQVRLPTTMGDLVVKATSNDLPGFFDTFDITALTAAAANIAEFSGNNQDGTIGRELPLPFKVRVTDPFGNPVSGHEVQWVRTIGSGSPSSSAVMTDEDGFSSFNYTLGNAVGANQVKAITTFDPVVFDATGVTNNFPLFSGLTDQSVVEGNTLQFQVTASDADSDPITYEAQNLPLGASFDNNSRTFSWTPGVGVYGEYQVTFIARDNKGGLDSETITVTVLNSNNPPVIDSFTPAQLELQFNFGQTINFAVNVSDPDGDDIEYLWLLFTDLNSNGTKFSTSFDYEFITSQFSPGTYIVRVEVTDKRDTVVMEWRIDIVTSVELASFEAQFGGFDGVQVSWTTSREIDNLGFDILRSRSEDGPYTKITDELLPADSDGQYQFIDKNIQVGVRYYYKLEDVNLNGVRTEHGPISVEITAPETFELSQNYPNPFNPETTIRYQLPSAGKVTIKVFNILGRQVRVLVNEKQDAGYHVVTWDARDGSGRRVSTGVYYYQIIAGEFKKIKKMILMK